ncbi:hypothetical protein OPIT5_30615 [Opitutaceae bacterium TAV5]|nr:hypothetical protein OPIT5_30615 [Opitutaceae bacterium TAV5]
MSGKHLISSDLSGTSDACDARGQPDGAPVPFAGHNGRMTKTFRVPPGLFPSDYSSPKKNHTFTHGP